MPCGRQYPEREHRTLTIAQKTRMHVGGRLLRRPQFKAEKRISKQISI